MKYLLLMLSIVSTVSWAEGYKDLGSVEPGKALPQGEEYHQAPDWNALPEAHFAEAVKRGYSIFMNSQQEKESGAVGNGLNCTNCHLYGGQVANSAPLWAAYVSYPAYRGKNKKVNSYEDRLQGCFNYSMNGTPPEAISQTIRDLTAYSYWLATDVKVNSKLPGRGFPKLKEPTLPADFARGEEVYQSQCAFCHGDNGEGRKVENRYVFPPLWGKDSYNWGAGMHKIDGAANFIKANMPLSKGNSLTDQEAWDVSMFINSHERPQDPRMTKSVAETTKAYHGGTSQYGKPSPVDKHILGTKAY
ncbi:c-type cytochrome [Vibrio rumoiensis]|uniref:Cytochrome C n=1 Tax=Vibrio rumoiensis 1S-45 TaxID=1188252 RepID=A0A1E5E0Q4_9VIBR|nr:c-type cytochrome [Vibrio rumoiensis]OEF24022.1 cytochrome C [Vibrio rumoiensis 1S-45]